MENDNYPQSVSKFKINSIISCESSLTTNSTINQNIKLSADKRKKSLLHSNTSYYKLKCEELRKISKNLFNVGRLLSDHGCAYQKEILIHGHLYITQIYIYFHSNIFGKEINVVIKWKDIVSITKEKLAKFISNSIQIRTSTNKYFFLSFKSKDKTYFMMKKIWQHFLLHESLSNSDTWQWVHYNYGNDLDIDPNTEGYVKLSNIEIFNFQANILKQMKILLGSFDLTVEEETEILPKFFSESQGNANNHDMNVASVLALPYVDDTKDNKIPASLGSDIDSSSNDLKSSKNKKLKNISTILSESLDNSSDSSSRLSCGLNLLRNHSCDRKNNRMSLPNSKRPKSINLSDINSNITGSEGDIEVFSKSVVTQDESKGKMMNLKDYNIKFNFELKENEKLSEIFQNLPKFEVIAATPTEVPSQNMHNLFTKKNQNDNKKEKISEGQRRTSMSNLKENILENLSATDNNNDDNKENSDASLKDCPCLNNHQDLPIQCFDEVFNKKTSKLFKMIFEKNNFWNICKKQNYLIDVELNPWKLEDLNGTKVRNISYTLSLNYNLGPRFSPSTERQILHQESRPGEFYLIDTECFNSAIPHSDNFYIVNRYCISKVGKKKCRLRITSQIKYRKKTLGVIKSFIEKFAKDGLIDTFNIMAKLLRQESDHKNGKIGILDSNLNTSTNNNEENNNINYSKNQKNFGETNILKVSEKVAPLVLKNSYNSDIATKNSSQDNSQIKNNNTLNLKNNDINMNLINSKQEKEISEMDIVDSKLNVNFIKENDFKLSNHKIEDKYSEITEKVNIKKIDNNFKIIISLDFLIRVVVILTSFLFICNIILYLKMTNLEKLTFDFVLKMTTRTYKQSTNVNEVQMQIIKNEAVYLKEIEIWKDLMSSVVHSTDQMIQAIINLKMTLNKINNITSSNLI